MSAKTWGVATTDTAPPATLRFEEARKDAHAAYFEHMQPSRSARQPAWVEEDRKEANAPFGDAWDSRALPTPEFQEPGPPIELEADGVTVRPAGTQPSFHTVFDTAPSAWQTRPRLRYCRRQTTLDRRTTWHAGTSPGMDSQKYRMTQGYTASGLRMDKDCWGRPFGH